MRRVSIIIPVYNEEERIAACLEAIAVQTVRPHEVIVVDNNSTDNTVAIADRYPFVSIIRESRQGVVHARNTGFNAARGDIIGRIDADTRLPADWVARVRRIFRDDVDAVSGSIGYYDAPLRKVFERIDFALRGRTARLMGDRVFLQGANMAVRKSAWRGVRRHLCNKGGMHEDFDLAIHLGEYGYRLAFTPDLRAEISARCLDDGPVSFWRYAVLNPSTYFQHRLKTGAHMLPAVCLVLLFYVPLRLLYRARNGNLGNLGRVNPATYVD